MSKIVVEIDTDRRSVSRQIPDQGRLDFVMEPPAYESLMRVLRIVVSGEGAAAPAAGSQVSRPYKEHGAEPPDHRPGKIPIDQLVEHVESAGLRNHNVDYVLSVIDFLTHHLEWVGVRERDLKESLRSIERPLDDNQLQSAFTHARREEWIEQRDQGWVLTSEGSRKLKKLAKRHRANSRTVRGLRNGRKYNGVAFAPPKLNINNVIMTKLSTEIPDFRRFAQSSHFERCNNPELMARFAFFLRDNFSIDSFDEHDIHTMYSFMHEKMPEQLQVEEPVYLRGNIENHLRFYSIYDRVPGGKYRLNENGIAAVKQNRLLTSSKRRLSVNGGR